jgi:hypothetical protein
MIVNSMIMIIQLANSSIERRDGTTSEIMVLVRNPEETYGRTMYLGDDFAECSRTMQENCVKNPDPSAFVGQGSE